MFGPGSEAGDRLAMGLGRSWIDHMRSRHSIKSLRGCSESSDRPDIGTFTRRSPSMTTTTNATHISLSTSPCLTRSCMLAPSRLLHPRCRSFRMSRRALREGSALFARFVVLPFFSQVVANHGPRFTGGTTKSSALPIGPTPCYLITAPG